MDQPGEGLRGSVVSDRGLVEEVVDHVVKGVLAQRPHHGLQQIDDLVEHDECRPGTFQVDPWLLEHRQRPRTDFVGACWFENVAAAVSSSISAKAVVRVDRDKSTLLAAILAAIVGPVRTMCRVARPVLLLSPERRRRVSQPATLAGSSVGPVVTRKCSARAPIAPRHPS